MTKWTHHISQARNEKKKDNKMINTKHTHTSSVQTATGFLGCSLQHNSAGHNITFALTERTSLYYIWKRFRKF